MTPAEDTPPVIVGEHIFPATRIAKWALEWKACVAEDREEEASELLEDIIIATEPMLRRFCQHEGFDRTCDLESLISLAMERVVKWTLAWGPEKGPIFSFFCVCSKNAWRSEVNKETTFRKRFHVTADSMEKFIGSEDHELDRHAAYEQTQKVLHGICSRWGSKQEIGTIKFLLECLMDTEHKRTMAIRAAGYAYGLSDVLIKYFYSWGLVQFRMAFYSQIRVPFTEQDLMRHAYSYTHLVDLLDIITFDQLKKIIGTMGGIRLKIPTVTQVGKLNESYRIWRDIEETPGDPTSIEEVAKKHKKTPKAAQEVYTEMCEILDENRSTEEPLYEE